MYRHRTRWYHYGTFIIIGYLLHLVIEGVLINLGWYYVIKPLYTATMTFVFT